MLFKKAGLAGGRLEIDPEVPANSYKPYTYTTEDARKSFKKYEIGTLNTSKDFKILNGFCYVDEYSIDLADKTIGDLFAILPSYGVIPHQFTNSANYINIIYSLPAVLLTNCNNVVAKNLGGDRSPLLIPTQIKNDTIKSERSFQPNILVIDSTGKKKPFKSVANQIFFEPTNETLVYASQKSTTFTVFIDFSPRRLESEKAVAHLLNYRSV